MTLFDEASEAPKALEASLEKGLRTLSNSQSVVFTQYTRSVVSNDGSVYWVNTYNTETHEGSLHIGIEQRQDEDQTIAVNHVIFTSFDEISAFNTVGPNTLWIGEWETDNTTLKVVFNETAEIYQQAGIWHYRGDAVYPALESQLIDSASNLPAGPIVSNSLPIFLAQNTFADVYPSYLVSENLVPPYIVVHIEPGNTIPLGMAPLYVWPGTTAGSNLYDLGSSQLMQDRVEITLYGFDNQKAIQYLSSLMDYSLNTDDFGFCNSPAIMDEKRKQTEIATIAQKKKIVILASYYQATADAVARRLILSAALSSITYP